eukprot:6927630-Ditylum_brightwellii.AAC.1
MSTIELVKECLLALKDRTGSSLQAINKWIESEKKVSRLPGGVLLHEERAIRICPVRIFDLSCDVSAREQAVVFIKGTG